MPLARARAPPEALPRGTAPQLLHVRPPTPTAEARPLPLRSVGFSCVCSAQTAVRLFGFQSSWCFWMISRKERRNVADTCTVLKAKQALLARNLRRINNMFSTSPAPSGLPCPAPDTLAPGPRSTHPDGPTRPASPALLTPSPALAPAPARTEASTETRDTCRQSSFPLAPTSCPPFGPPETLSSASTLPSPEGVRP